MKIARKWKRIAVVAVVAILSLAGAEYASRRMESVNYYKPPKHMSAEQWNELIYQRTEFPGLIYELAPNRDTMAHRAPVRTNSFGMRDAEPRVGAQAAQYRIAAIGDSFTFGFGVAVQMTYPDILEHMLNRGSNPGPFEVLNFGVGGYSSQQEALVLEHKVLDWKPDLITVGYVFNDPEIDPIQPVQRYFLEASWWHHSNLLRWFARSMRDRLIEKHGDGDYVRYLHWPAGEKWKSVTAAFDDMHRLSSESGIPVLLMIFPMANAKPWEEYPYRDLHTQVSDAALAAGLEVIDLLDLFSQHPTLEMMVSPTNRHPSALGHRVAAEAGAAWIKQHMPQWFDGGKGN